MRAIVLSLALTVAAAVGGCTLATPLMEPLHRWEEPFDVSSNVRGYVVFMHFYEPATGVRVLERTYRYERYEPITGNWYAAELTGRGDYEYTDEAEEAIAAARGIPAVQAGT